MPENHLAYNLNWRSRPGRVSGRMPSQIMRAQMDSYETAGLVYDYSHGWVGNREDPSIWLSFPFSNIFSKTMSYFLGNEDDLCLMAAFRVPDNNLSVLNVSWSQPKNLPDSHPAARHEFQHEPVS